MTNSQPSLPFVDLVSPEWFKDREKSSIWVRGYRARPVLPHHVPTPEVHFRFKKATAALVHGSVTYAFAERPDIEPTRQGDARFRTPRTYGWATSTVGTYLLLVAPHDTDGIETNEESTEERLDELEGLLTGFGGRAMVYQRFFDNIIHLGTGKIILCFGAVDNPAWYDPPNLHSARLDTLAELDMARAAAAPALRSRIDLSLRWLAYAGRDRGVDAFIKYWVAIEILAMPDTTKVRPANDLLASAYGLPLDDVVRRFCLGRMQGIRSAIVHDGLRVAIPGEVAKFLEAIYFDLVAAILGIRCAPRAPRLERQGRFTVPDWVAQCAGSA